MATGASKAKREFRKQETKAYYEALNKLEKADPLKKIDTQSARKLDDTTGGEVSYGAKRLAMKADKLGRSINADPSLNKGIEAFNKRFDEMKRQMKGETVKKFVPVDVNNNAIGLSNFGTGLSDALAGQTAIGRFDTAEEAAAAAPAPKKQTGLFGMASNFGMNQAPTKTIFGMSAQESPKYREANLTPITGGYRELAATKGAYKDLEKLSKGISENAAAKMTKEYEVIGNQLKAKLKRETNGIMTGAPQGLLTSELASAAPKQEVIQ
jgi:hypothetical protein